MELRAEIPILASLFDVLLRWAAIEQLGPESCICCTRRLFTFLIVHYLFTFPDCPLVPYNLGNHTLLPENSKL